MNDEYLEQKMQELRELGESYGKAKSLVTSLEYGRQILKSVLMKKHMLKPNGKELSVNAQEREALSDPEYADHIQKLKNAVYDEAKFRWDMKLAEMKFERWKTLTIAQMKEYKQYGNKI